jgi:hypothetical protein
VLRDATQAGDWATVSGFFARFSGNDEHSFGSSVVMAVPSAEPMLRTAVQREPGSGLAPVLLAAHLVQRAWTARTSARATHVSRAQFAEMHEYLRQAERILIDVTAREPANALAWHTRLSTSRGLGLGQSESRRRYDRLAAHHVPHLSAQRNLLQQLCPKWGGSWEAAEAFVRECTAAARPGAPEGVLVADLHLERWLDLGTTDGVKHLRQPSVHEELAAAAAASVLHPAYRSRFGWVSAHSTFAMVFSLIGDEPRAAGHFRALDGRAGEIPWAYLPDPVAELQRRRARALAKG